MFAFLKKIQKYDKKTLHDLAYQKKSKNRFYILYASWI